MNRRDFLKLTGATGAVLTAAELGLAGPAHAAGSAAATGAAEQRIPTLCEMCTSRCGIYAVVENGKVTRIEGNPAHPTNLGRPCARGNAGVSALYDPDRLQRPMKRGADGKLQPISWEQAFKEIGAKLTEIKLKYAPETVAFIEYNNLNSPLTKRFIEAYGSPNHTGHAANCFANRNVGYSAVFGTLPTVDYKNVKYYLSPGRNLLGGIKVYEVAGLAEAKEHGAKIVVLDPRYSELATWGEWVPIKSAGDLAFLLAIANVLITENLYNKAFVEAHCNGFEETKAEIVKYTPEWQVQHTDIPADKVREIAREMAKAAPAAVVDPGWHGGNGMYWNGFEAARAGAIVNALLGNWGAKGGLKGSPKVELGTIDTPPEGAVVDSGGGG
ncbi:MAG TPA: molybdopterin-dependent oxidoreductase [Symbiobacteriaceae bacterium]|nr:molybdopterin-dependent oxidoreductase [Symbiobacteriaceae bacterium]